MAEERPGAGASERVRASARVGERPWVYSVMVPEGGPQGKGGMRVYCRGCRAETVVGYRAGQELNEDGLRHDRGCASGA
jgi:hypothetical protein